METAAQWFSISDIEKLKYMASFGHDGRSIARALSRSAQSVRVKAVELGVSLRKPSAIMDASNCHQRLGAACSSPRPIAATRPRRSGRLVIETVVNEKLINAIIDDAPPKKHQMATQPDPQWAAALARECKPPPVSLADAFTAEG
jgi:hypothetical protein